jgi:endoribonuclease Dicer
LGHTDPTEGDLLLNMDDTTSFQERSPITSADLSREQSSVSDIDEDENEASSDSPSPPFTRAEKSMIQEAAFEDLLNSKDNSLLKHKLQELEDSSDSTNGLSSKGKIIDKVREYQSELFARAKAGNVIAVLGTGCGKTLVAALLLRDVSAQEMDDRASGKSPRTSFFLVWLTSDPLPWCVDPAHFAGQQCRSS